MPKMANEIRVAVVGAGAAGLCALRQLTSQGPSGSGDKLQFVVTCLEKSPRVGGTWYYTNCIGKDEYGLQVHSSMYKNLRTNLPVECMAFPDYPFPEDLPSFVRHKDVQKYLEDYTAHFNLSQYIKFLTIVKWIEPVVDETSQFKFKWAVTTCNVLNQAEEVTQIYEAVLVCNGHYATPKIPNIPGLETFTGQVLHSHDYRTPESFSNKVVVLLGAAASGQDISLELSHVAKVVYLSHHKPQLTTKLPKNLLQKPGIKLISESEVQFLDDSKVRADILLLCTGYYYDYDFLSPGCGIRVDDGRVTPIYQHLINTNYPTMAIVGVCKVIVPFPIFDVQVRYFRSILDGTCILPSKEEMDKHIDEDYRARLQEGLPHRYAHTMGDRQFTYINELADLAKTNRIPDFYSQLYHLTSAMKQKNLMEYKNANFVVDDSGRVKECTERTVVDKF
ncbi:unnamed protein product [Lymnaea stagnalis]|uniref:Flavin-containing monooxygenase n=1 Tax=Lymnaea stagnalis TaxID=6523 RepID=A0AAV2I3C2_LYMST